MWSNIIQIPQWESFTKICLEGTSGGHLVHYWPTDVGLIYMMCLMMLQKALAGFINMYIGYIYNTVNIQQHNQYPELTWGIGVWSMSMKILAYI